MHPTNFSSSVFWPPPTPGGTPGLSGRKDDGDDDYDDDVDEVCAHANMNGRIYDGRTYGPQSGCRDQHWCYPPLPEYEYTLFQILSIQGLKVIVTVSKNSNIWAGGVGLMSHRI